MQPCHCSFTGDQDKPQMKSIKFHLDGFSFDHKVKEVFTMYLITQIRYLGSACKLEGHLLEGS
jgi:hypothetical protein